MSLSHEVIQRAREAAKRARIEASRRDQAFQAGLPSATAAENAVMRVVLEHLRSKNYVIADDYGDHWNVINLKDVDELLEALGDA